MLAIGNDELGKEVKKGDYVIKGELKGYLEYGTNESGEESNLIGFVTVEDGTSYMASLAGKLLEGWEIQHENK